MKKVKINQKPRNVTAKMEENYDKIDQNWTDFIKTESISWIYAKTKEKLKLTEK